MNLTEAKQILNKKGYILEDTDDKPITVNFINKYNYKDYIGKFVNVTTDVYLGFLQVTELPIRFGKVGGYFTCSESNLTSLEGSPKEVGGEFACDDNQLTTLKGAPEKVGGYFDCHLNKLTSLECSPREVGGSFYCYDNKLTTLKGAPRKVKGGFFCFNNELTSLEGCPKEVGGSFHCRENKVQFTEEDVRAVSNVNGEIEV